MYVNKLSLNVDKTNFIIFGNRKNVDNVFISMNSSIITIEFVPTDS